jgi:tRNA U34 5-methylaminomethyl-2-thiouridine-forming methyltransferase MnmC
LHYQNGFEPRVKPEVWRPEIWAQLADEKSGWG